jgi:hypothetical protein
MLAAVDSDADTVAILWFCQLLSEHLESRFPEETRKQWYAIDQAAVNKTTDF